MIPVDALLFDLDGTLIDSKKDLALSIQYLQRYYHVSESTESEVASYIGDGVVKLIERALRSTDSELIDEAVPVFKKYYREHSLDFTTLYPHTEEVLHHFRKKKLAVVTNKPLKISRYLLEEFGIASYFSVILGGDSMEQKKPHPAPLKEALRQMAVPSSQGAVMVGDSVTDVLAGRNAGARTCGIVSNIGDAEKLRDSKPDFLILNLNEMTRLFS